MTDPAFSDVVFLGVTFYASTSTYRVIHHRRTNRGDGSISVALYAEGDSRGLVHGRRGSRSVIFNLWYVPLCAGNQHADRTITSPLPFPGPDLWHSRRAAWLAGSLILNPAAPKVAHDTSLPNNEDAPRSSIEGSPPTSATTTLDDHPKPVLSAIQSLSAKARGKLPSFLHPYSPSPTASKSPSPPLTSLEKLEMLLAEPGAEENEKVWRQGGLEAVWRMLTDSKVLKQPMRLGLVVSPSFVCSGRALMVFGS
jgi:hypothetical protein